MNGLLRLQVLASTFLQVFLHHFKFDLPVYNGTHCVFNNFSYMNVLLLKECLAISLTSFFLFVFLQMAHYVVHFTLILQKWWLISCILCSVSLFNLFMYSEKGSCATTFLGFWLNCLLDLSSNGDPQWWGGSGNGQKNQLWMNFTQCRNHMQIKWEILWAKKHLQIILSQTYTDLEHKGNNILFVLFFSYEIMYS